LIVGPQTVAIDLKLAPVERDEPVAFVLDDIDLTLGIEVFERSRRLRRERVDRQNTERTEVW
jgi:hypothetical protein